MPADATGPELTLDEQRRKLTVARVLLERLVDDLDQINLQLMIATDGDAELGSRVSDAARLAAVALEELEPLDRQVPGRDRGKGSGGA